MAHADQPAEWYAVHDQGDALKSLVSVGHIVNQQQNAGHDLDFEDQQQNAAQ